MNVRAGLSPTTRLAPMRLGIAIAAFVLAGTAGCGGGDGGSGGSIPPSNAQSLLDQLDGIRSAIDCYLGAGGLEITQLTATTTYDEKTVKFTTNIKEKTRELDARGSVILHPDHQEIHLPELAMRTQGVEWRTRPGTEALVQ